MSVQKQKYCTISKLKQQQFSWNHHTQTNKQTNKQKNKEWRRRRIKMRRKINEDKV